MPDNSHAEQTPAALMPYGLKRSAWLKRCIIEE